ncbi:MAG: hypothetical protein AAGG44_17895 [Planctomycetota bacterium]
MRTVFPTRQWYQTRLTFLTGQVQIEPPVVNEFPPEPERELRLEDCFEERFRRALRFVSREGTRPEFPLDVLLDDLLEDLSEPSC